MGTKTPTSQPFPTTLFPTSTHPPTKEPTKEPTLSPTNKPTKEPTKA
jgi:hypothetical protein